MPDAVKELKITAYECTCQKCGHVWLAKVERTKQGKWQSQMPVACAKCKDPRWQRQRET